MGGEREGEGEGERDNRFKNDFIETRKLVNIGL